MHLTRSLMFALVACALWLNTGCSAVADLLGFGKQAKSVTITPPTATLNARPADGDPETTFVTELRLMAWVLYSDKSTDSAVSWTVSDPALGAVEDGVVTAAPGATAGILVVTAVSKLDKTISATASVRVTADGRAEARID